MRLLIAPDKFKGSLTAAQAAEALAQGWREGWPASGGALEIEKLPIADGGEGTAEAICDALGGRWVTCTSHDPLGRPIVAKYVLAQAEGKRVAVMEMSEAGGLWRLTAAERDVRKASTYGVGEMLRHALVESVAERVLIGIGGSATNDGGVGLASALGFRFFREDGLMENPLPEMLRELTRIEPPVSPLPAVEIRVACDVANHLLGARGATAIYGPQKGLRDKEEEALLEAGLKRLAVVAAVSLGTDFRNATGAGAAGGLGFGLLTFCQARLQPGFDLVAEFLQLEAAVLRADVVLTGEGSLDAQSLEGKAPVGIAGLARRHGKPALAFAGRVAAEVLPALRHHFESVCELRAEVATPEESIARAAELLRQCARRSAASFSQSVGPGRLVG